MTQKPKRLSLERLEARQCLAASPLVTLVRGNLIVRGTDAAESVWIAHDEAANRVEVRVRQAGEAGEVGDRFQGYFETAGLRRIQVQLGGGDDALSIVSQDITKPLVINVNGGSGDDTVYLRAVGDVPAAASLSFDLLGGEGNDSITADVQGHLMGVTDLRIAGGNGDDSLGLSIVALSNPCPPIAKLSGDGGNDMLRVDFGASDGPIGLASHRGIIADGGSGQDTLTAPVDVVSQRVETHQSASSWRAFVNASVQPIIEEMANIGVFVGIVGPNGTRETYSFGAMNEADKPVTSHTAFEIGSITKTFTASLLADMVARGEVSLDDPVRLYLPADADVPRRGDRELTLLELATHTSGLPRDTHDFDRRFAAVLADIEAGQLSEEHLEALFTAEIARDWPRLRDDLKEITLDEIEHPPHMYSNLGMGLLGFALARHLTLTEFGAREAPIGSGAETASVSYESAIRNRILSPLGLRDIFQAITPSRESSIATGTAYDGETTTPPMLFDTLAGAGALRATGLDMLRYLDAQTGRFPSPLNAAIAATHEPRDQIEADPVPTSIGLGWFTAETPAGTIVGHNGATFGFQSEIRFNATTGVGFVVLMNSTSEAIAPAVATLLDNLQTSLLLTDQPNAPAAPPSATISWESAKGIVLITGTANADTVSVQQRDGADTITVTTHIEMDGGDQLAIDHVFASSAVREIQAELGEGDDQLSIRMRSLSRGASIRITGRLGAGNDSARLELENPISSRASVVASLFGELGDDDLQAFSVGNSARTTSVLLQMDGGDGDDFLRHVVTGRLEGNMWSQLVGGGGDDQIYFDASNRLGNGHLLPWINGQAGDDQLAMLLPWSRRAFGGVLDGGTGHDSAYSQGPARRMRVEEDALAPTFSDDYTHTIDSLFESEHSLLI